MIQYLKELYENRLLLSSFVLRDIKARYKYTALGITWAVIQPLFLMFIFTILFSFFFKVSTGGIPYPVFSYVALLPWTFVSRVLSTSGGSLIGNRGLITKIYFPREIIPLSTVFSALIDFFFGAIVFAFMLLYYKIPIGPTFAFILLIFPVQLILASGLALLVSVLTALFRDLEFAMPLMTQLWMYASPVIYSVHNLQPRFKLYFYLNPMVGIIDGYRDAIVNGRFPDFGYLLSSLVISLILLMFGYWLFKRVEYYLVDIM